MGKIPHPIPYQGSKRKLAKMIFSTFPKKVEVFYEPFAGSAAMTIFCAANNYASEYVIGDSLEPLVALHKIIIEEPQYAILSYNEVWNAHGNDPIEYFYEIRERYNNKRNPIDLLYCIARCVKNAVRFSKNGNFTQSVDKRRLGMKPDKMKIHISETSKLLKGRTSFITGDWLDTSKDASSNDLIYLDPPYLGTSVGRDKRYHQQLEYEELCSGIQMLLDRNLKFALSYDGKTGERVYGPLLPKNLGLRRFELQAGLSSQSTLSGKREETIESLYLSPGMNGVCAPVTSYNRLLLPNIIT